MSLSPRPEQPMRIRDPGCDCGKAASAEDGVGGLNRRQYTFELRALGERVQRLLVRRRFV